MLQCFHVSFLSCHPVVQPIHSSSYIIQKWKGDSATHITWSEWDGLLEREGKSIHPILDTADMVAASWWSVYARPTRCWKYRYAIPSYLKCVLLPPHLHCFHYHQSFPSSWDFPVPHHLHHSSFCFILSKCDWDGYSDTRTELSFARHWFLNYEVWQSLAKFDSSVENYSVYVLSPSEIRRTAVNRQVYSRMERTATPSLLLVCQKDPKSCFWCVWFLFWNTSLLMFALSPL